MQACWELTNQEGKVWGVLCLFERVLENTEETDTGLRGGQTIDAPTRIREKRGLVVCMSAVTWRMRQMKRGFVLRLHDIVKAFCKVKHSPPEIATFLMTMHRRGREVASGRQRIRTGDTAEPRIFRGVYDDATHQMERTGWRHQAS